MQDLWNNSVILRPHQDCHKACAACHALGAAVDTALGTVDHILAGVLPQEMFLLDRRLGGVDNRVAARSQLLLGTPGAV